MNTKDQEGGRLVAYADNLFRYMESLGWESPATKRVKFLEEELHRIYTMPREDTHEDHCIKLKNIAWNAFNLYPEEREDDEQV